MAKRITDPGLKLDVTWEEAATHLLKVRPGSIPKREIVPRKKRAKKKSAKK